MFGRDQPIALQLLGSQRSRVALEGVAMELEDSLYPLLREVGMLERWLWPWASTGRAARALLKRVSVGCS